MKQRINLNTPTTLEIFDNGERAHVVARVLRQGTFTSGMNGATFKITTDDLIQIKNHYNGRFKEYVKSIFQDKLPEYDIEGVQFLPNCIEHQVNDEHVVGRIIGNLWLEDDKITQAVWLHAKIEVLGKENVDKLKDGRRKAVSINFNTETYELQEISFVAYGAVPDACILSASNSSENLSEPNTNTQALFNRINKLDDSIDNHYKKIQKTRQEIEIIDKQIAFENKLQSLVKTCQLTKADMNRIISSVGDVSSLETLDTVIAVLSRLPKCVDTRPHKYVVNDSKLREYLMNKKELTTDEVLAQLNQVASTHNAQFTSEHVKKASEPEVDHANSEKHDIKLSKADHKHLKALMSEKKYHEANEYLCSLSEDDETENGETHANKKLKKAEKKAAKRAKLKEHEENMEKDKKEKAELKAQLDHANAQLSSLTTALNNVVNKEQK